MNNPGSRFCLSFIDNETGLLKINNLPKFALLRVRAGILIYTVDPFIIHFAIGIKPVYKFNLQMTAY